MSRDLLFKTDDFIFSYRVAAIIKYGGKVLLQRPSDSDEYSFPGGHVAYRETNAETLIREFGEETGLHIQVGNLLWVGEIFFHGTLSPAIRSVCSMKLSAAVRKLSRQYSADWKSGRMAAVKSSLNGFRWSGYSL